MQNPFILFLAAGTVLPFSAVFLSTSLEHMRAALWILLAAAVVMVAICIVFTVSGAFSGKRKGRLSPVLAVFLYIATILQLLVLLCSYCIYTNALAEPSDPEIPHTSAPTEHSTTTEETTIPETEPTEEVIETTEAIIPTELSPIMTDSSNPRNFDITWEILVDNQVVDSYQSEAEIRIEGNDYFSLPGIGTFRGNNYRTGATYGTAEVTSGSLTKVWSKRVGYLISSEWIGCGWTGQPLIVQWDDETKAIMNLYDNKKEKEGLVEVIYAKLDGYIHFFDLEDGTPTRDPIYMGMAFKGAGALDPRGYPLLYVGAGLNYNGSTAKMYVVSLIDGSILYKYGNGDSNALRAWYAFDSSPLVDADTDTLIWPGENGLLYSIKLNTEYDKEAGTIAVNPNKPVKTRYTSQYSKNRYIGYEDSSVIVGGYMYIGDNGGLLYCVDLNTMELVWAQDLLDDINSTPVFDWGNDGNGYIYAAPSLDYTAKSHAGEISIYKLNASTGEIIWSYAMDCVSYDDISGGVQSSPLLGEDGTEIEDVIIYSVGRTPGAWEGKLVALDKETGELVWEASTGNYSWSSPVAIYTDEGDAYIFLGNASGNCYLYDGGTGEIITKLSLNETIEASPVVYGNMIVLGTREGIYGIKVS